MVVDEIINIGSKNNKCDDFDDTTAEIWFIVESILLIHASKDTNVNELPRNMYMELAKIRIYKYVKRYN